MIESGEDFGFALEQGEPLRIPGHRCGEHLDGHWPLQVGVGGPVYLSHSAHANLGGDFIGAKAGAGSEGQTCGLYGRGARVDGITPV